ncbi:hypothetical protein GCM10011415_32210 [Salipiger pallidus]|uniref:Uncharacterized protein n=1 Tax=Salipiger pallidus TaxID=1775170 RepID=A0A8J2ZLQ6_9RHOB|nr:hypothetical protein GCM10011415_32210 [Salipiger pallidus]
MSASGKQEGWLPWGRPSSQVKAMQQDWNRGLRGLSGTGMVCDAHCLPLAPHVGATVSLQSDCGEVTERSGVMGDFAGIGRDLSIA